MLRDDVKKQGLSQEEEYFYKLNRELIEKRRKEEAETRAKTQPSNWMLCPKCGQTMEEQDLAGVRIDRCAGCSGLYFDAGELEVLLESREQQSFWNTVKTKLFRNQ